MIRVLREKPKKSIISFRDQG